ALRGCSCCCAPLSTAGVLDCVPGDAELSEGLLRRLALREKPLELGEGVPLAVRSEIRLFVRVVDVVPRQGRRPPFRFGGAAGSCDPGAVPLRFGGGERHAQLVPEVPDAL